MFSLAMINKLVIILYILTIITTLISSATKDLTHHSDSNANSNTDYSGDNNSEVFPPILDPFSPKRFKMIRQVGNSTVPLTEQVQLSGGTFYFGSQTVRMKKVENIVYMVMMMLVMIVETMIMTMIIIIILISMQW